MRALMAFYVSFSNMKRVSLLWANGPQDLPQVRGAPVWLQPSPILCNL